MQHSKSNLAKLAKLKYKVRLVEKSGQFHTVHHQNLANFENYLKGLAKPAPRYKPTPKEEKVKEEQDGK